MLLTFTPQLCKAAKSETGEDVPAAYSGTVTIRMPTNAERMEMSGEIAFMTEAQRKDGKTALAAMLKAMRDAAGFVKAVDIKRTADGYHFTKFEEVQYESGLLFLEKEIAERLLGSFKVGVEQDGETVVVGALGN